MKINIKKIKSFIVKNSSFISVALILLFTSYLWIGNLTHIQDDLNARSQSLSSELGITLENAVNHRIDGLKNIGDLWIKTENPDDLYNYSRYKEYIAPYYLLAGGFFAINWISTDSIIKWVYPEEENQAALNKNVSILADGIYNYALNNSINQLIFSRTPLINLFQDQYGFATYFPLIYNGNLTGLFNGVFALNNLFDTLLNGSHMVAKLSEYSVNIIQNQSYVYSYGEEFAIEDSFVIKTEIDLLGIKLELQLRPNANWRKSVSILSNFQIIIFGVSLSCLVGILAHNLQKQYELVRSTLREKRKIEEKLFVKQKMESLGTLAGGITHDFNNILAGIRGNIELILINLNDFQAQANDPTSKILVKECFEGLDEIQRLIDRSIKLNRQITEFSQNPTSEFEILNVNSTIQDSLKSFSKMIDQRISLKTDFIEETTFILGDKARFNQLILNLLINARDAIIQTALTETSKAEIRIVTRKIPKEKSKSSKNYINFQFLKEHLKFNREFNIEICVEDTGIGIPVEIIDKIFDPFFTTKDKSRGTGLGLTIVYNVAKFMEGTIKVESNEGVGTKFRIELPLLLNSSVNENVIQNKLKTTTKISYQKLNKINILLVEDEHLIYESLTKYLKNSEANVTSTQNGNDGYILFKKKYHELDLVILDINLPGMNGVELYYKIKEISPKISVLFITGYSEYKIPNPDRFDLGILTKPFSLNELARKLDYFSSLKDNDFQK
ncbi:ATP-binding protein [Promethearchaeum syntrophicum]|uniref:ATP-binding protein n=1 Tax=Promethearchaeum syntrophicum TaxID=2594042 RepID=A0A5B9D601_9ARCH|nr:ATP-binding protein [Candidatus Prometheoarchaeum syntrophicum]QEE14371.1 sensory histidine kinase AtoS [Candidatus Prometheoarchaeum syntrophicum]